MMIDATINGTEEQIGAIAEADLRVAVDVGEARKAADIGNGDGFVCSVSTGSRSYKIRVSILAKPSFGPVTPGLMMGNARLLPAKQNRRIGAPIEIETAG